MSALAEGELAIWREDILLNEHHEHWHAVYPYSGKSQSSVSPVGSWPGGLKWNARHGELFYYMHQQMIARYNAERYSLGLASVLPYSDCNAPIEEGYDPRGLTIVSGGEEYTGALRPPRSPLATASSANFANRPSRDAKSLMSIQGRIEAALGDVTWQKNVSLSLLAELIEPTDRVQSHFFGAMHNDGHILTGLIGATEKGRGVMFFEESAVRDPFFYQWHANINRLFQTKISLFDPPDLSDLPDVEISSIYVDMEGRGRNALATTVTTAKRLFEGRDREFDFLSHTGFSYFITINSAVPQSVVLRVFLCPERFIADRDAWIEMDKFRYQLGQGENVVERRGDESSVVRQPVILPQMLSGDEPWPKVDESSAACQCGWPYTLLLPRGSGGGSQFRLFVIATPGGDLPPACAMSGASYCGVKDGEYPDARAMGYPFSSGDSGYVRRLVENLAGLPQVRTAKVTITHERDAI